MAYWATENRVGHYNGGRVTPDTDTIPTEMAQDYTEEQVAATFRQLNK